MKNFIYSCFLISFLLYACGIKETNIKQVDVETITKDDAFRKGIITGNFIQLSKGYTYYEYADNKSDTVVVMVHGFSVPSYIWDSTYYAVNKKGYNALRYDTYGRGYSDCPDEAYVVTLFAQQLSELLDSLNITQPITLLGLSDGGRTISLYASKNPSRIANLVYVDAAGFDKVENNPSGPVDVTPEEVSEFKKSERYSTMAKGQLSDFYDSIPFRGWDTRYAEMMRYKGFARALISTNKNRTDLENEHRLIAASGIPVFALWGEHDTVVKLNDVRESMVNRIPGINLFVISKAGHLPHMEQTQQVNEILLEEIIQKRKNH